MSFGSSTDVRIIDCRFALCGEHPEADVPPYSRDAGYLAERQSVHPIVSRVWTSLDRHRKEQPRSAGSIPSILDGHQVCGHALTHLVHCKPHDHCFDGHMRFPPMSPCVVLHVRIDGIPCTISVDMCHDSLHEAIELLLPLFAWNHCLRGTHGRGDVAAGQQGRRGASVRSQARQLGHRRCSPPGLAGAPCAPGSPRMLQRTRACGRRSGACVLSAIRRTR